VSEVTRAIDRSTGVWSRKAGAYLTAVQLGQFTMAEELREQAVDAFRAWCDTVAEQHRRAYAEAASRD
jgi:hypothetical protein